MARNVYGGYCRECGRWTPPGFGHFERRGRRWLVHCVECASGGKGALVSDEVSLMLSTSNTQTLFSEEGGDMVVRRLTPRECERLQGFPSDWTKIPYRGKPADECPDGPRYKAVGNSMAVPVMRWIGERIAMAEASEIS